MRTRSASVVSLRWSTALLGALAVAGAALALGLASARADDNEMVGGLGGLTSDGTIYLAGTDHLWHLIPNTATLKALGLDKYPITWYGRLPGTLGDPLPAIAPPPAPAPSTPGATVSSRPVIGAPAKAPAVAVAGKGFTISFPVTRSDTGAKLTSGAVSATSSIGGIAIKPIAQFSKGVATVKLAIPGADRGKLLKVSLTIKVGTTAASRVTTFRIAG